MEIRWGQQKDVVYLWNLLNYEFFSTCSLFLNTVLDSFILYTHTHKLWVQNKWNCVFCLPQCHNVNPKCVFYSSLILVWGVWEICSDCMATGPCDLWRALWKPFASPFLVLVSFVISQSCLVFSANMQRCGFIGRRQNFLTISVFLIVKASSTVFLFTHSVAHEPDAIAEPQQNVLNLDPQSHPFHSLESMISSFHHMLEPPPIQYHHF